jgi:uncharacterized membrane protein
MSSNRGFLKRSLIGGLLVILPSAIFIFFFSWFFRFVTDLLEPFASVLTKSYGLPLLVSDLLALLIIIFLCFIIGTIVTTSVGKWVHGNLDIYLERLAPGYRMIREIVNQFFGDDDSPFTKGQVARVHIFGRDINTTCTALVTSEHKDGSYTVFVPTSPNPTSGILYHVPGEYVELRPDIKVDSAMRTIIACGAGSDELFNKSKRNKSLDSEISDPRMNIRS